MKVFVLICAFLFTAPGFAQDGYFKSYEPLSWEYGAPGRADWSRMLLSAIDSEFSNLDGAADMEKFCPRYSKLGRDEKVNAWAEVFVGISKYESSWQPTMRFLEPQHQIDSVTRARVYSEGLLQLSYQDTKVYPACDFRWSIDRLLHVLDSRKTIFNPHNNLNCGVQILAQQISRAKSIHTGGSYWSTLRRASTVTRIQSAVRQMRICE